MNEMFENIRKVAIAGLLLLGLTIESHALTVSGTITDNRTNGNCLILTTNRASIYSIEITASANTLVNFYDVDVTNVPVYGTNVLYYTNLSYVSRVTFPTNYVYSFVGNNGYTNWYTNQGVWTVNVTNAAATNIMNPFFSAVVAGNTYAVYNVDALCARGVTALATSGTNIAIVVNYRSGQ